LKDLLKRKGGGLFRWVEIQIVNFRERPFKTPNEIERHLERLERDTSDKELDDEYRTLFGLLKDSELDLDRAIRMLKFIACAIDSLTVDDLAETITAYESEQGLSSEGVTPDDVRRILIGFIMERAEYQRAGVRGNELCDVVDLAILRFGIS
jgi:hypothetical protein